MIAITFTMTNTPPRSPTRIAILEGEYVVSEHKSLFLATRKAPPSPEAEIRERGTGWLLAESDPFDAKWVLTKRGEVKAQAEMLTVMVALADMADEESAA